MLFFLEDIPENDYNITLATFAEHFKNTSGVFTVSSGKSFYDRVFPKDSIDLGMCFNALHWLSAYPATLPGYNFASSYIDDESRRDAWSTQAKNDLAVFLRNRVEELRPGGHLLCQMRADQFGETMEYSRAVACYIHNALKARGLEKVAPYYRPNWFYRRTEDIEESIKEANGGFKVVELGLHEKIRITTDAADIEKSRELAGLFADSWEVAVAECKKMRLQQYAPREAGREVSDSEAAEILTEVCKSMKDFFTKISHEEGRGIVFYNHVLHITKELK